MGSVFARQSFGELFKTRKFNGTSNGAIGSPILLNRPEAMKFSVSVPWTVGHWWRAGPVVDADFILGIYESTGTAAANQQMFWRWGSDRDVDLTIGRASGTSNNELDIAQAGQWVFGGVTFDPTRGSTELGQETIFDLTAKTRAGYADCGAGTDATNLDNNRIQVGAYGASENGNRSTGTHGPVVIFDQTLTNEELTVLAFSPWQIFESKWWHIIALANMVTGRDFSYRQDHWDISQKGTGSTVLGAVPHITYPFQRAYFPQTSAGGPTTYQFVASIAATSTVTAALTKLQPLVASITGTSTVTTSLTGIRALVASITGTSTVTADLTAITAIKSFAASIAGTSTVTAALSTIRVLDSSITGTSTVTAIWEKLAVVQAFAASITGTSTVTVSLTKIQPLVASITGNSTVTVSMTSIRLLTASVAAVSSVTVDWGVPGVFTSGVKDVFTIPDGGKLFVVPDGGKTFTVPGD